MRPRPSNHPVPRARRRSDVEPPVLPRSLAGGRVTAYAIYRSPPGEPGPFYVVRWRLGPARIDRDPGRFLAGSLADLYRAIPEEVSRCLQRRPSDDAALLETWV